MYVSLRDVAARAGVSFQTASRVLNGRQGVVCAGTRERIPAAASELRSVPNALARGLVQRSSVTVGVLANDHSDLEVSQLVLAAQRAVAGRRHPALVANVHAGHGPELAMRKLLEHRVDGILVAAPSLEENRHLGRTVRGALPAVSINRVHGGGVPVVGSDHTTTTGTLAAQHLLALGHRRIGTVTGPRQRRAPARPHPGPARRPPGAAPRGLIVRASTAPPPPPSSGG